MAPTGAERAFPVKVIPVTAARPLGRYLQAMDKNEEGAGPQLEDTKEVLRQVLEVMRANNQRLREEVEKRKLRACR